MKKFLVIMLAMLWMSVAAFSQITISQEDYDKLPSDTRTQIEKITTEKAIKGEIKEVSEYANLGKEIGVAVQKMIESGLTPEMVVQYKTVDQLTGIAEASAQMFEHVHLGQVTVYGNENTAGNFMAKTAENLNPAFDLLRSIPFADTLKSVLGKKELEEKKAETTEFEEVK